MRPAYTSGFCYRYVYVGDSPAAFFESIIVHFLACIKGYFIFSSPLILMSIFMYLIYTLSIALVGISICTMLPFGIAK